MAEKKPTQQQPTEKEVQESIAFAVAAANLAGCTPPTTEELERLERVARGEITTDEAIAEIRHRIQGV